MRFFTFASGSSGNSYMIESGDTIFLLDTGIAGKRIIGGLDELGKNLEDIDGIFLTHEHSDHVKSIRMISRKAKNAPVYATEGTFRNIEDKVLDEQKERVIAGDRLIRGNIEVSVFGISHDADEPVSYSFSAEGKRITVITDTGVVKEEMYPYIFDSDLLVLEANHEKNILMMGPYPYSLKQRITGPEGHISNDDAGKCISQMLKETQGEKRPAVYLAHLSGQNNTANQAYLTVRNILFEDGFLPGRDLVLNVLERDKKGPYIEI